ncbi:hypothetical protein KUV57_13640 [Epibacterium sp. DP7N7-1]|nr:hypothetical protein [Epibacterium sp. DP7N7-1]
MLGDHGDWADLAPWGLYGSDLVIRIEHILTEPTCPVATVSFEIPERAGIDRVASGIGNTVEEAIQAAITAAKERLAILPFEPSHFMRGVMVCEADDDFVALRPWKRHHPDQPALPGDLDREQLVEVTLRDIRQSSFAAAGTLCWATFSGPGQILGYRPVMRRC